MYPELMGNRHKNIRYDRESAIARRILGRKFRRRVAQALIRGDEALPRPRGTQGWNTW
jgi:hypothetical protein